MHEYELKLLSSLIKAGSKPNMAELEKLSGLKQDALLWAAENLSQAGAVKIARETGSEVELTEEGKSYLSEFPEEALVRDIHKSGNVPLSQVKNKIGLIWAKKNKWISIGKTGSMELTKEGIAFTEKQQQYPLRQALNAASEGKLLPGPESSILEKRGLITVKEKKAILGISITASGKKLLQDSDSGEKIGQLTKEIIQSSKWERVPFKPYDVAASTERIYPARIHPVSEFMDIMRNIFVGMGFKETSGPVIETAFWAFDTLFSPQDHPTREMQDTFFLSNPKTIDVGDVALLSRVKKMHEEGWKEPWQKALAEQAILRQHTTSVSARNMQRFADLPESSYPLKLFSIGKVFRNESIDYKHLAELYMCDGIIIGNNLNMANLIHTPNAPIISFLITPAPQSSIQSFFCSSK